MEKREGHIQTGQNSRVSCWQTLQRRTKACEEGGSPANQLTHFVTTSKINVHIENNLSAVAMIPLSVDRNAWSFDGEVMPT